VLYPLGQAGLQVRAGDEALLRVLVGQPRRHHPDAVVLLAGAGHLVEVLGGEEPGVGHEPFVHRAELVDAELRIGDEAAVPAPLLL